MGLWWAEVYVQHNHGDANTENKNRVTTAHCVSGRNGPFSDLTSDGRILNFTGMP